MLIEPSGVTGLGTLEGGPITAADPHAEARRLRLGRAMLVFRICLGSATPATLGWLDLPWVRIDGFPRLSDRSRDGHGIGER